MTVLLKNTYEKIMIEIKLQFIKFVICPKFLVPLEMEKIKWKASCQAGL